MKNNISFIVYSHSSYSDLWEAFFDRAAKHVDCEFEKYYLFADSVPEEMKEIVPSHFEVVTYEDNESYTERLSKCLSQIETDYCLFHHEDMILCGDAKMDTLNEYFTLMNTENIDFIKLLKGGAPQDTAADTSHYKCESLRVILSSFQYIIAIQPSIWRKKTFLEIVNHHQGMNIWDFETKAQEFCRLRNYKCFYSFVGDERKRGNYHWDSSIYPVISTAVFKGKWTTTEYYPELKAVFDTYKINPDIRGVC